MKDMSNSGYGVAVLLGSFCPLFFVSISHSQDFLVLSISPNFTNSILGWAWHLFCYLWENCESGKQCASNSCEGKDRAQAEVMSESEEVLPWEMKNAERRAE